MKFAFGIFFLFISNFVFANSQKIITENINMRIDIVNSNYELVNPYLVIMILPKPEKTLFNCDYLSLDSKIDNLFCKLGATRGYKRFGFYHSRPGYITDVTLPNIEARTNKNDEIVPIDFQLNAADINDAIKESDESSVYWICFSLRLDTVTFMTDTETTIDYKCTSVAKVNELREIRLGTIPRDEQVRIHFLD